MRRHAVVDAQHQHVGVLLAAAVEDLARRQVGPASAQRLVPDDAEVVSAVGEETGGFDGTRSGWR